MTEATAVEATPTEAREARVIDANTVLSLMNAAVDEKGVDYIYTQEFEVCQNFDPGTGDPKCIVGHILYDLGVTSDDCRDGGGVGHTVNTLRRTRPELTLTLGAVMVMQAAQTAQDSGVAWGQARDIGQGVGHALSSAQSALPWEDHLN